ncbi:MAG: hypothetical protein DDT38_01255 [Firmicutes bacterium]|nr:hypothetical protein [candidate division NPL-UPA2 bacterium]
MDALGAIFLIEACGVFEEVNHFHLVVVENFRRQVADILTNLLAMLNAVAVKDGRTAAGRKHKPKQRADCRGFSGAVWPDEAENLSFSDAEA